METNIIEAMSGKSTACYPAAMLVDWGPMMQFVWIATGLICIVVVGFAFRNAVTIFRRDFSPADLKGVNCRISISKYSIVFLAAIWLLTMSAFVRDTIWSLVAIDKTATSWKAMIYLGMTPPVTIAWVLVVLIGVHGIIGVTLALRENNMKN